MKKSHFLGDWWFFMWFLVIFWLGLGNPRHIATKSQHLWAVPRQIEFWSILKKSWDWVRPPPPSLGQIPNFYQKFVLRASLSSSSSTSLASWESNCKMSVYKESRGREWLVFIKCRLSWCMIIDYMAEKKRWWPLLGSCKLIRRHCLIQNPGQTFFSLLPLYVETNSKPK